MKFSAKITHIFIIKFGNFGICLKNINLNCFFMRLKRNFHTKPWRKQCRITRIKVIFLFFFSCFNALKSLTTSMKINSSKKKTIIADHNYLKNKKRITLIKDQSYIYNDPFNFSDCLLVNVISCSNRYLTISSISNEKIKLRQNQQVKRKVKHKRDSEEEKGS